MNRLRSYVKTLYRVLSFKLNLYIYPKKDKLKIFLRNNLSVYVRTP